MAVYQDLLKDSSTSLDNNNYFNVTITDLNMNESYPLQFRWKYSDGTFSSWGATKRILTPGPSVPDEPYLGLSDVTGEPGFIKVTWNGNNAASQVVTNIDRVDIHIANQSFGDGTKPAGSFKVAGTQTFAATPGSYVVQLKAYTVNGSSSFFSTARTVSVTAVGEVIESPKNPNGFSASRVLAGVQLSWSGTYANGTFTGFEAIKIYAGTSATATVGTYTEVGVLTGNNVKNTITIPVDGTYVIYGQATYLHAAAVNKATPPVVGTIQANVANVPLGPGKATDADINDGAVVYGKIAANAVTVDMLAAGSISATSYIRAGTKSNDGLTGARVEISSSTVTQTGTNVLPGFYIYNSAGTAILSSPLSGGLSVSGSLAATSISTASGKFAVNSSGILTATDVDLTGLIKASSGNIGGILIAADAIQNGASSGNSTFRLDSTGKARFGSATGSAIIIQPSGDIFHTSDGTNSSGKFTVLNGGLTISGTINSSTINSSIVNSTGTGAYSGTLTIDGGYMTHGSGVWLNSPAFSVSTFGGSVGYFSIASDGAAFLGNTNAANLAFKVNQSSSGDTQFKGIQMTSFDNSYYSQASYNSRSQASGGINSSIAFKTLVVGDYGHLMQGRALYYGSAGTSAAIQSATSATSTTGDIYFSTS